MPGIFISYRREDCGAIAGRLYDRLNQRFGATNVFRDIDAIDAGAQFADVIAERIRACDALIALIGKNWLDARDVDGRRRLDQPRDFVALEISEALAQGKLVIPTLIEDASMPTREALPPRMASLADRHAIPIGDSRFDYDVGRLIGVIEKVIPPHTPAGVEFGLTGRNRRDLLNDVKGEVANRLAQSLHSAVLIDLLKEKQPQQVRRPWDDQVKGGHQPSMPLPPGTEIIDVFDQDTIAGRLLLLGAPGAGKTTTLLQLARKLTARAETDAGVPMPILLNLSSWKDDNQALAHWMEAELRWKYGVRKDIGKRWLDERCLLPLLDGLDELEPTRQDKCVQAINHFQQDYRPEHLVVCCRLAEYQNCNTKLQLNGAIHLQPLTDEQVCNYLVSAKYPELWNSIQIDAELLELARSPLLLRMLTLAYETRSIQEWHKCSLSQERWQYLFDAYIESMLSREINHKEYTKERTMHWLTWLAQRLREQAQADFVIEKLQPTWLQSRGQEWIYRIAVVLFVALVFGLFQWLIDIDLVLPKGRLVLAVEEKAREWMGRDSLLIFASSVVSLYGLIAALIIGLMQSIKPIETLQWSGARAWSGMVHGLRRWSITGVKYATYVGLITGQIGWAMIFLSIKFRPGDGFAGWSRVGQVAGVISGLIAAVAFFLIARPGVCFNRGLRGRVAVSGTACLISGLICGIIFSVSMGPLIGVAAGLSIGIIAGLSYGLSDRPDFRVVDALIVGLIGGLISGWLTGSLLPKVLWIRLFNWMGMGIWLHGWLGVGATAGLVAELMAKLRKGAKPAENLQRSETEVWNWPALIWRQWLIAGVVAAAISSVILVSLIELGQIRMVQGIGMVSGFLGLGVVFALSVLLLTAVISVAIGSTFGGFVGALLETLSGALKGPEIERRIVPNQGIRQSARNVWVFALIGGLTLGPIWGLLNLPIAVLMTGLTPEALDWLRFQLSGVLLLGLLSGLVPGAACIQHFALRFILWCRGVSPWNYTRFLNYATERMLLQRVGGRYRFIHELLREHFATMEPKRVES